MCGYVCVGCGRCGKPHSGRADIPSVSCLACGAEMIESRFICAVCGTDQSPGKPVRRIRDAATGQVTSQVTSQATV